MPFGDTRRDSVQLNGTLGQFKPCSICTMILKAHSSLPIWYYIEDVRIKILGILVNFAAVLVGKQVTICILQTQDISKLSVCGIKAHCMHSRFDPISFGDLSSVIQKGVNVV